MVEIVGTGLELTVLTGLFLQVEIVVAVVVAVGLIVDS